MQTKKSFSGVALITLMLVTTLVPVSSASAGDDASELQSRLEKLSVELEKRRVEFHIPGMAIAVVKDDQVVFARGFGVSDLEKKALVTPDTLFAVGSSTKAFTATLVGVLVDEGKMQWDDPITQYLPFLQFPLENKEDEVTLRDMLSHRSGYSRNDLLWINGNASRDEILHNAIKAEAWTGFREKFHYNNVMYLGAGIASARAADSDWDNLLEERLLRPLGMNKTTTRFEAAQENPNLSLGYVWREEEKKYQQLPMRNLSNIAPAGAINSNVMDMAQWLRLNLAMGVYEGHRIISKQQLLETRTTQIAVDNGVDYGLGWFLREWQGQPVVEHGGSIDGFGAEVAFLPESNLGFVLLTNVTTTPLQQLSTNIVWKHLLGETDSPGNVLAERDATFYAEYLGDYVANFGPFEDATITFLIKDGVPAIDVPGQRVYELEDPNDQGKWVFTLTDEIAISFDRDANGSIAAMRMHQSGYDYELPRSGVPIVAEIDPSELQRYVGQYRSELFDGILTVLIRNHRLALDIPDKMTVDLHLPDIDGHRRFRIQPKMSAVFEYDNNDQVSAISIYRGPEKMDTAPRAASESTELPSLESIMVLRQTEKRKAALLRSTGFRITGKITLAQSGVSGKLTSGFQGIDRYRLDIDLGKMGHIRTALNEDGAATDGIEPYTELHGKYLEQVRKDHPAVDVDWLDYYESAQVVRAGVFRDRKGYTLRLNGGQTPQVMLFIDAETGDVLKRETRILAPGIGSFPVNVTYSDYREVHGLRIPYKTVSENKMNGRMIFEYETVETNIEFGRDYFVLKKPK